MTKVQPATIEDRRILALKNRTVRKGATWHQELATRIVHDPRFETHILFPVTN
jgi:hypothetical protein